MEMEMGNGFIMLDLGKLWKTALSKKCDFSKLRTCEKHTFLKVINFAFLVGIIARHDP